MTPSAMSPYRRMDQPSAEQIRERHALLVERLRRISEESGHDPGRLRLVAVTKAHPLEVARAARDAGLRMLGESRVQEADPKIAVLPEVE